MEHTGIYARPTKPIHNAKLSVQASATGWERNSAPGLQPFTQPGEGASTNVDQQEAKEQARKTLVSRAKAVIENGVATGGPLTYNDQGSTRVKEVQHWAAAEAIRTVGPQKAGEPDDAYKQRVDAAVEEAKQAIGEKPDVEDATAYQARVEKVVTDAKAKVGQQLKGESATDYQLRLGKATAEALEAEIAMRGDLKSLVGQKERWESINVQGQSTKDETGAHLDQPHSETYLMFQGLQRSDQALAGEFDAARRMVVGQQEFTRNDYIDMMVQHDLDADPKANRADLKKKWANRFDQNAIISTTVPADVAKDAAKAEGTDTDKQKQLTPKEQATENAVAALKQAQARLVAHLQRLVVKSGKYDDTPPQLKRMIGLVESSIALAQDGGDAGLRASWDTLNQYKAWFNVNYEIQDKEVASIAQHRLYIDETLNYLASDEIGANQIDILTALVQLQYGDQPIPADIQGQIAELSGTEPPQSYQLRLNTAVEAAKKSVGAKKPKETAEAYQARLNQAIAKARAEVGPLKTGELTWENIRDGYITLSKAHAREGIIGLLRREYEPEVPQAALQAVEFIRAEPRLAATLQRATELSANPTTSTEQTEYAAHVFHHALNRAPNENELTQMQYMLFGLPQRGGVNLAALLIALQMLTQVFQGAADNTGDSEETRPAGYG